MQLLNIKFRNIGPFGSDWSELDFTAPPELWQLIGRNGAGKTTIQRIIKLGIYQEADGIVQAEIANELNGKGEIETTLRCRRGIIWRICVGFSPSYLKVYKEDAKEPESLGGVAAVKQFIRREIVDVPYYVFNNTISLSVADFKSFLRMKPKDARDIRDRIFSFHAINEMMTGLKKRISEATDLLTGAMQRQRQTLDSIETAEIRETEARETGEQQRKAALAQLEAEEAELREAVAKYQSQYQNYGLRVEETRLVARLVQSMNLEARIMGLQDRLTVLERELAGLSSNKQESEALLTSLATESLVVLNRERSEALHRLRLEVDQAYQQYRLDSDRCATADRDREVSELVMQKLEVMKRSLNAQQAANRVVCSIQESLRTQTSILQTNESLRASLVKVVEGEAKTAKAIQDSRTTFDELLKKQALLESGKCPLCQSDLTDHSHQQELVEVKEKIQMAQDRLVRAEGIIGGVRSEVARLQSLVRDGERSQAVTTERLRVLLSEADQIADLGSNRDSFVDALVCAVGQSDESLLPVGFDTTELMQSYLSHAGHPELHRKAVSEATEAARAYETSKARHEALSSQLQALPDAPATTEAVQCRYTTSAEYENAKTLATKAVNDSSQNYGRLQSEFERIGPELAAIRAEYETVSAGLTSDVVGRFRSELANFQSPKQWVETREIADSQTSYALIEQSKNLEMLGAVLAERRRNLTAPVETATVKVSDDLRDQLAKVLDEVKAQEARLEVLKGAQFLLSDEGVKAHILRDIVPNLNGEIDRILRELELPIVVGFDEEFVPHVRRAGKAVSLQTLSVGQTKMVDCAIILALTRVLKMKYGSLNLVFYDEIFSSIDPVNRATMLSILQRFCCRNMQMHAILVGHAYMPSTAFGYIARVSTSGNYSVLEVMTPDEYEQETVDVLLEEV